MNRRLELDGGLTRGREISIQVDGERLLAYEGETVAAALLAAGKRTFRYTSRSGEPRGLYCGMGVCYECLLVVDGLPNRRACMTYVREGMQLQVQAGSTFGSGPG